jgi:hypothetical protein
MDYNCNICKKKYSSYQSLWIHSKKFHNNESNKSQKKSDNGQKKSDNIKNYNCRVCSKIYNNKQSRWAHEKICKVKTEEINTKEEIIFLKEEINKLKNKPLGNKKIINNNNNNTNNGTINNIVINEIGKEPVSSLTANEIRKLSDMNLNAFTYIIELLNFNKKRPENHNFCITSLEGDYFTFYNKKSKNIEKKNKKDFINIILNNATRKLEDIAFHIEYDMMDDKNLDNDIIKKLQIIAAKSNDIYMNYKKSYERKISELSYNNKEMVLATLKNRDEPNEDDYSSVSTYQYAIHTDSDENDSD